MRPDSTCRTNEGEAPTALLNPRAVYPDRCRALASLAARSGTFRIADNHLPAGNSGVKEETDALDTSAGNVLGVATKRAKKPTRESPQATLLRGHAQRAIDLKETSGRKLADKAELSDSTVNKFLAGTAPRADTFAAIAKALGLDPANIPPLPGTSVAPPVALTIQDEHARDAIEHLHAKGELDDRTRNALAIFERRYKNQAQLPPPFASFEDALAAIELIRAQGHKTDAWLEEVKQKQDLAAELLADQRKARNR